MVQKKNNKIFLLIILILLAIVTISFFVENNVKSYNIQDNFDIYDFIVCKSFWADYNIESIIYTNQELILSV